MNPLEMVWNLKKLAVNPFTHSYNEIFIVLETSGSCCDSIIDGLESPGNWCEAMYILL